MINFYHCPNLHCVVLKSHRNGVIMSFLFPSPIRWDDSDWLLSQGLPLPSSIPASFLSPFLPALMIISVCVLGCLGRDIGRYKVEVVIRWALRGKNVRAEIWQTHSIKLWRKKIGTQCMKVPVPSTHLPKWSPPIS